MQPVEVIIWLLLMAVVKALMLSPLEGELLLLLLLLEVDFKLYFFHSEHCGIPREVNTLQWLLLLRRGT